MKMYRVYFDNDGQKRLAKRTASAKGAATALRWAKDHGIKTSVTIERRRDGMNCCKINRNMIAHWQELAHEEQRRGIECSYMAQGKIALLVW